MANERGFFERIGTFIAGAAAVVTVGSVGYCVKEADIKKLEDNVKKLESEKADLVSRLNSLPSNADCTSEVRGLTKDLDACKKERLSLRNELAELKNNADVHRVEPIPPPPPPPEDQNAKMVNGIKFELLDCARNGSTVLCSIRFTSIDKDVRDFYLTTDSNVNASATEVTAKFASFGSNVNQRHHGWGDLVAGIPKDGSLLFEGIGVNEKTLLLLELRVVVGSNRFNVRFANVELK